MERISLKPAKTINPNDDNPKLIPGTKEENVVCAFMSLSLNTKQTVTAQQFLTVFIELMKTIYAGVKVNFNLQPQLKNSNILKAVTALKGQQHKFLEKDFFLEIVKFLCQGNELFLTEAKNAYSEFEGTLLLSAFFPGTKY
jgi:hypothetical protein